MHDNTYYYITRVYSYPQSTYIIQRGYNTNVIILLISVAMPSHLGNGRVLKTMRTNEILCPIFVAEIIKAITVSHTDGL